MAEETAGVGSQPPCLPDGLTDDYEYWHGELPEAFRENKTVLYVLDLRNLQAEWDLGPVQEVPDRSRFCREL